MNFWERFKIAWATFRRLGGMELPDNGRSSDETLNGAMSAYTTVFGSISPVISFEMLKTLKCHAVARGLGLKGPKDKS